MQSSKGKWSLFIIVIVIIIVIAVVANKSFSSSTIKIGAMYPLTGGLATYGEPSQKTAQLAVDDINAAGGINGKKLEVVFQDHKCDPKAAVSALQQLTGSGIRVFTSGACTGTVLAMEPILQSTDSVLVGSTLSGSKISSSSPNVFRNWGQDINEAKLFADTIKQAGYKKVAVIYEETDYAKGLEVALENYLKGTSVKVSSESFTTGATDIRTQLTKLKGGNPDLLFVSPQTVTSGEVVLSQMEELKFSPARIFVNDNVIKSADLVSKHAKILQGALGGDYVIAQNDKLAAVLQKYKLWRRLSADEYLRRGLRYDLSSGRCDQITRLQCCSNSILLEDSQL